MQIRNNQLQAERQRAKEMLALVWPQSGEHLLTPVENLLTPEEVIMRVETWEMGRKPKAA